MPYICRSARADGEIKMDSIHWVSAARSDTGRKRKVNEDAIFVSDTQALWCVADGMGGHKRGDAASQLVAFTMGKLPPQISSNTRWRRSRTFQKSKLLFFKTVKKCMA